MHKFAAFFLIAVFGTLSGSAKADIVVYDIFINDISPSDPSFTAGSVGEIDGCDQTYDPDTGFSGCFGGDFDSSSPASDTDGVMTFEFANTDDFFLNVFFEGNWISWSGGEQGYVGFDSDYRVHTFSFMQQTQDSSFDISFDMDDSNDNGVEANFDNTDFTADVEFAARAVPEPTGVFAMAIGLLAMISLRRKV